MSTYTKISKLTPFEADSINDDDLLVISHKYEPSIMTPRYKSYHISASQLNDYVMESVYDTYISRIDTDLSTKADKSELSDYLAISSFSDSGVEVGKSLEDFKTMINSMLNESNMYVYVDPINGHDFIDGVENKGNDISAPVKTIYHAVKLANKRKFIGGSCCYIRLLNDLELLSNGKERYINNKGDDETHGIELFHPDLVQIKFIKFEGWGYDADANKYTNIMRTIKYNQVSEDLKKYTNIISIFGHVEIKNITIDGSLNKSDDMDDLTIFNNKYEYGVETYAINGRYSDQSYISNCEFKWCHNAILQVDSCSNIKIDHCYIGIRAAYSDISLDSPLYITNCTHAIVCNPHNLRLGLGIGMIHMITRSTPIYFDAGAAVTTFLTYHFLTGNDGSSVWEMNDDKTYITSDVPKSGCEDSYMLIGRQKLNTAKTEIITEYLSTLYNDSEPPTIDKSKYIKKMYNYDPVAGNNDRIWNYYGVVHDSFKGENIQKLITWGLSAGNPYSPNYTGTDKRQLTF